MEVFVKMIPSDAEMKYNLYPKLCTRCGEELYYHQRNNKYCSRSCSVTVANSKKPKRTKKAPSVCVLCGDPVGRGCFKFCSKVCLLAYRRKERIQLLLSDDGHKMSVKKRKYALVQYRGHQCALCQRKTWLGNPIPLVMDHIDGDSSNNTIDNLRLVCGNCDMTLPTYKGKNRGNGRHYRRERYRNGDSY